MKIYDVVIDTNVIFAGLYSIKGYSYKLLSLLDSDKFKIHISVSLIFEYEDVLIRKIDKLPYTKTEIMKFVDGLCNIAIKHKIYFLWRPLLKDPKDEHILELAFTANADYIITYNEKNFVGIEHLGIKTIMPKDFIKLIGE